jgi:transcriptional regulator with XRE-family HTH domain
MSEATGSRASAWTPQWSLGDRIRKIRHEMGLGQVEFAAKIGVTRAALGSWESGYAAGPRDVVSLAKRIELLSGVPAEWVLGLHDGSPPVRGADTTDAAAPDRRPGGGIHRYPRPYLVTDARAA